MPKSQKIKGCSQRAEKILARFSEGQGVAEEKGVRQKNGEASVSAEV